MKEDEIEEIEDWPIEVGIGFKSKWMQYILIMSLISWCIILGWILSEYIL